MKSTASHGIDGDFRKAYLKSQIAGVDAPPRQVFISGRTATSAWYDAGQRLAEMGLRSSRLGDGAHPRAPRHAVELVTKSRGLSAEVIDLMKRVRSRSLQHAETGAREDSYAIRRTASCRTSLTTYVDGAQTRSAPSSLLSEAQV